MENIRSATTVSALRKNYGSVTHPGKNAVVVGGTSGIGRGIAIRLAEADISTTIVGRNEKNGQEVVDEMKQAAPKDSKQQFSFIKCDAQLLANVTEFAKNYSSNNDKLDYLVLTQGIATTQGRTETTEGIDQKLSLHFYSRMTFIYRLLPLLKNSKSPRVLSVLSGGVHSVYGDYKNDTELKKNYSLVNAANSAGFYNDLMLDAFSRENPEITFIHSAPGFVNTNWGNEMPFLLKGAIRCLQVMGKSPADCAEFMCEALFNPDQTPGFYIRGEHGQSASRTKEHNDESVEFMKNHTFEVINRS